MAQHIELENFKDEKGYAKLNKDIDEIIGKRGKYYSLLDLQTDEFLHSGRNSETKADAVADAFDFFEDVVICPCGHEFHDYEEVCDECHFKVSKYCDDMTKYAEQNPDDYVAENQTRIVEHEFLIPDEDRLDDSPLTALPDDYAWNGGTAYMYKTKITNKLSKGEILQVRDCGIEIHINREREMTEGRRIVELIRAARAMMKEEEQP